MNILNKLTIKHLTMNKKRTIVTIIGVILSTALMVGIGLLFSSLRDYTLKVTIRDNGSHHIKLNLPYEKINLISKNKKIKEFDYISPVGFARLQNSNNDYKPYLYIANIKESFYKNLNLLEGRFPLNENEVVISNHIENNGGVVYEVGDILELDIGKRLLNNKELLNNEEFNSNETLIPTFKKQYTIVGIVERSYTEDYSAPGYTIFTTNHEVKENDVLSLFVTFKNPDDTYKLTNILATTLGYKNISEFNNIYYFEEIEYNDLLLSLYGTTQYGNVADSMFRIIVIVLALISIGCIVVIYNSFAISVMERKKQFGLFSSIGATKNQLRKTVFFEAVIISIIGIPLGIISGILGIGIVLKIVNNLISEMFSFPLSLTMYPLFIVVPILFMILTIFISAFIPAYKASRVSPIMAIRQNDDIKIKGKKIKSPKWVCKIFGIEGDIAYKNMKRNKKKYRITTISLITSIVLFISFSGFVNYTIKSAINFSDMPSYDMFIENYFYSGDEVIDKEVNYNEFYEIIRNHEQVEDSMIVRRVGFAVKKIDEKYYKKDFYEKYIACDGENCPPRQYVTVLSLDDKTYNSYKKKIGLKENRPILINSYRHIDYADGNRKSVIEVPFHENKELTLSLYYDHYTCDKESIEECRVEEIYYDEEIKNIYYTNKLPNLLDITSISGIYLIVDSETFDKMTNIFPHPVHYEASLYLKAPKYNKLDKLITEKIENKEYSSYYYVNVLKEMQFIKNLILVVKIFVYGFISLVTLIGVTSVFNTINTSILLRRKEFSMLRSMGLTPRGFNKILYFESLFVGLESLFYAIPISLFVLYLLHKAFDIMVSFNSLMIPWISIIEAIIGVFIIVLCAMYYASSKIKNENILEALREENI